MTWLFWISCAVIALKSEGWQVEVSEQGSVRLWLQTEALSSSAVLRLILNDREISSTPVTVWLDSDINKVYIPSETCSMISVWMCVSCRPVRWTLTRPTVWWRSCLIRYQETTRARTPHSSKTAGPRTSSRWCLWIRVCLLCHIITLIYRAALQGKCQLIRPIRKDANLVYTGKQQKY